MFNTKQDMTTVSVRLGDMDVQFHQPEINPAWRDIINCAPYVRVSWRGQDLVQPLDLNWHQASYQMAARFAQISKCLFHDKIQAGLKNTRSLPPEVTNKAPRAKPHYRKANLILRWLRSIGVELEPVYHPLQRRAGYPKGPPPPEFVELWNKDHVYRGLCYQLKEKDWSCFTTEIKNMEALMLSRLSKPYRRRLAQRKMSVAVALSISRLFSTEDRATISEAPMWAFSSTAMVTKYLMVKLCELQVRAFGRSPSKDFTRLTRKSIPKEDINEWHHALYGFGRAGGVVPTSFRGVRKLLKDLHDRTSMAYRLVNRRDRDTDVWVPNMDLPVLPDIQASIRVLQDADDYSNEGRLMNHCIGMYAGTKGLFAHIERGKERASLYLSCEGSGYQCLGPCNQMNTLTRDVTDFWLPVLKEWISPDKFVNKTAPPQPEPALPEYD